MSQDTTTINNEHHADHDDHAGHEHFIADWKMQIGILALLLFFTALTVGFYNLESWIETSFEVVLPKWVNIAGAMSIATVKAILVAAFFMQLKYDKALNTFVLLFCLFCVSLFLTFSMIDLGSRDWVVDFKAESLKVGGTGLGLNSAPADEEFAVSLSPKVNTAGLNLVQFARLHGNDKEHGLLYYRENDDEATFWAHFYDGHAHHRDALDEHNFFEQLGFGHHEPTSNSNESHPKHGLTPGLYSDVDPKEASHSTESHGNGH